MTMKRNFKTGIKTFFRGLIKNNACYEGGTNYPWWAALIIALVGIMIAIIPTMVTYGTANGADFITTNTNLGLEVIYADFFHDLSTPPAGKDEIKIDFVKRLSDETMIISETKEGAWKDVYGVYTNEGGATSVPLPWVHFRDSETLPNADEATLAQPKFIDFEIYYFNDFAPENEKSVMTSRIENIKKGLQPDGKERSNPNYYEVNEEGENVVVLRNSFAIFSTSYYATAIYNRKGELLGEHSGNYKKFTEGASLSSISLVTINEVEYTPITIREAANQGHYSAYTDGVLSNLKDFYNTGHYTSKWNTFWGVSGVTFAVYLVLELLLGFVVWLTTRGKKNPMRFITFLDSVKMVAWLSFTPGVLALLGFLMPQLTPVVFVLFLTFRVMFFSFRSLKPGGVVQGGPSDQGRGGAPSQGQPTSKPLPRGRG